MSRKPAPRRKRPNGTGSIRLIGKDSYELRYPAHLGGGTDRLDGTYAQAEAKLNKWIATRDVRFTELGPVPTLGEWAEKYLTIYSRNRHGLTEQTKTRRAVNKTILGTRWANLPINAVDESTIEEWLDWLATPNRFQGRPITMASLDRYRSVMSGIMRFAAERRKDVHHNPVRYAVKPAVDRMSGRRPIRFFDRDDTVRFIAQCERDVPRWGALFLTQALLGLRPGEACALHWADVHLDAATPYVYVHCALVRPDNLPVALGPTKTSKRGEPDNRTVELPSIVIEALREHRKHQRALGVKACDPIWDDMVFLRSDTGAPLPVSYANRNLWRLCKRAGIALTPRPTPYGLRHCCASWLVDAGIEPQKIAWRLGTSVKMLERFYMHKLDHIDTSGTAAIDALVAGGEIVPFTKRKRAG